MKKRNLFSFVVVIACLCAMVSTSIAAPARASDQIKSYDIYVIPTANTLNVGISVSGNAVMNKIGCESIEVYEKNGSGWKLTESLDEDDEGMSSTNAPRHRNEIPCDGEAGVEYKIEVTIFAEDDAGRDTRSRTLYVTGR